MATNLPEALAPEQLSALLARCALRDQRAFAELYRSSSAKLFAVAVRITRRRDWAEEVLQEAFVNIWNHADGYNAAKSAPMTWMTAIVRNRALDWLRRPREVEIGEEHEELLASIADESPGPEELLRQSLDAGALAECMKTLTDEQQRSISLAFFYGLSHGELAEQMRKPLGTVKTWIRRGLERLKGCLDAAGV
ncbi:MAG TPA: sigma-70 family RNA polymerase sigma factor [Burkholderiales bacterium]|nr:sigma-70 family RNA polymerase sigma factor [Burkholderiales bacterium]